MAHEGQKARSGRSHNSAACSCVLTIVEAPWFCPPTHFTWALRLPASRYMPARRFSSLYSVGNCSDFAYDCNTSDACRNNPLHYCCISGFVCDDDRSRRPAYARRCNMGQSGHCCCTSAHKFANRGYISFAWNRVSGTLVFFFDGSYTCFCHTCHRSSRFELANVRDAAEMPCPLPFCFTAWLGKSVQVLL